MASTDTSSNSGRITGKQEVISNSEGSLWEVATSLSTCPCPIDRPAFAGEFTSPRMLLIGTYSTLSPTLHWYESIPGSIIGLSVLIVTT